MSVVIVDYGMGNIASIRNMLAKTGRPAELSDDPQSVHDAEYLILPGVGAFDEAMRALAASGLREAILARQQSPDRPLLGVCLGMQLLLEGSEEGVLPGLGLIPGVCRRFPSTWADKPLLVPHMGWNEVRPAAPGVGPLPSIGADARYYFVHSYYADPAEGEHVYGRTSYGLEYASAIRRDLIVGVQFHPEKSHRHGMRLLQEFVSVTSGAAR